jgi:hypothetical protein
MPRTEIRRRRVQDANALAHDFRPPSHGNCAAITLQCASASIKWPVGYKQHARSPRNVPRKPLVRARCRRRSDERHWPAAPQAI